MIHNLISKVITTDTAIYASGDSIGGLLEFAAGGYPGGPFEIHSLHLVDKDEQAANAELWLFSDNPSASTFTDQAAASVADADADKVIGIIPVTGASYVDLGAVRVFNLNNVGLVAKAKPTSANIYAALVSRGTPTYSTTSALVLKLGIEQV